MSERFSVSDWQSGSLARFADVMGNPEKSRNIQQSAMAMTETAGMLASSANPIMMAAEGMRLFTGVLEGHLTDFFTQIGGTLTEGISNSMGDFQDKIQDIFGPISERLGLFFQDVFDKLEGPLEKLGEVFEPIIDKLSDEFLEAMEKLAPAIELAVEKFGFILDLLDRLGAFDIGNSFFFTFLEFLDRLGLLGGSSASSSSTITEFSSTNMLF